MPVITLMSPDASPGRPALARIAEAVTGLLGIAPQHCWVIWQRLDADAAHRPEWDRPAPPAPMPGQQPPAAARPCAPIGFVTCKASYPRETVGRLLRLLRDELSTLLGVPADEVYLAVRRAVPGELLVRGDVWAGAEPAATRAPARAGAAPAASSRDHH
ncbi:hypothetical protein [Streptomyces sp. AM6-12]|uniref:hypothetical protein n=1 Tax=Streptomyces sp. AM6-12 TaxID=3345149 RepID=UPI003794F136